MTGAVSQSGIKEGIAVVYAGHATGIIILNEYDPALIEDLKAAKQLDTLTTMSGRCKSMIEKIKDVDKASLNYLKSEMNAAKARLQPDEQEAA